MRVVASWPRLRRLGQVRFGFLFLALTAVASPVTAQEQRLEWDEQWREVTRGEAIAALTLTSTASVARLLWNPDEGRVFSGGIQRFDERARTLTLPTLSGRRAARFASDAFLWSLVLQLQVIDPAVVVWAMNDNRALALDLFTMNALSFGVTMSALVLMRNIIRRETPYAASCSERASARSIDCRSSERFRSFPSPHTAMAFTSAALTCTHHMHVGIYSDQRALSAVACGTTVAVASLVGILRWLSDRHYLSDILFGAALGVLSGYVLPSALHYGFRR